MTTDVDPGPALETVFRRVHTERMRGLPIVNESLEVQAVGFAPWSGRWLGVLVTPWFMTLVLLPLDAAQWRSVGVGVETTYSFPAGEMEFVGAHDPAVGEYQSCSLFSPMFDFADAATARATAEAALTLLFEAPSAKDESSAPAPRPMSKREFLRGPFAEPESEPRG